MIQSSQSVLGIGTDVYFIPAAVPTGKKSLVFFIAGNPGTIEFYGSFLQQFSSQLNSVDIESNIHYDIYCPGHAFHHLDDGAACNFQSKGLDFQIEHKIAFVTNILKSTRFDGEIILVGHSIGSFMLLDMISKNVLIKKHTKLVSLLMPFIFWDNIPYLHRAKLNAFVLSSPSQALLTGLIQLIRFSVFDVMPRLFLRSLVKMSFTHSKCDCEYDHIVDILCNRLFTHRLVNNFLHMGSDEIKQVPLQQKRMLSILQKIDCDNKHIYHSNTQNIKLHLLYTDNDEWAPSEDIERLKSTFTLNKKFTEDHLDRAPPRITYIEGLGHTFTLKRHAISEVVNELVTAITGIDTSEKCHLTSIEVTTEVEVAKRGSHSSRAVCIAVISVIGCISIDYACKFLR